jgi:hypothetical protein
VPKGKSRKDRELNIMEVKFIFFATFGILIFFSIFWELLLILIFSIYISYIHILFINKYISQTIAIDLTVISIPRRKAATLALPSFSLNPMIMIIHIIVTAITTTTRMRD